MKAFQYLFLVCANAFQLSSYYNLFCDIVSADSLIPSVCYTQMCKTRTFLIHSTVNDA